MIHLTQITHIMPMSGRHVARLHARPVDQWPGLLRRALIYEGA
jgi:hypothetical protein